MFMGMHILMTLVERQQQQTTIISLEISPSISLLLHSVIIQTSVIVDGGSPPFRMKSSCGMEVGRTPLPLVFLL